MQALRGGQQVNEEQQQQRHRQHTQHAHRGGQGCRWGGRRLKAEWGERGHSRMLRRGPGQARPGGGRQQQQLVRTALGALDQPFARDGCHAVPHRHRKLFPRRVRRDEVRVAARQRLRVLATCARYSAVQCSTVQYSAVRCTSVSVYSSHACSTVIYIAVQCSTLCQSTVQYDA